MKEETKKMLRDWEKSNEKTDEEMELEYLFNKFINYKYFKEVPKKLFIVLFLSFPLYIVLQIFINDIGIYNIRVGMSYLLLFIGIFMIIGAEKYFRSKLIRKYL